MTIKISRYRGAGPCLAGEYGRLAGELARNAKKHGLNRLAISGFTSEGTAGEGAAVELKARYWAVKVRDPGFSYSGLERAPGSELRDYGTLQRFYELFNAYYYQDGPVVLTEPESSRLKTLLEREAAALRECL